MKGKHTSFFLFQLEFPETADVTEEMKFETDSYSDKHVHLGAANSKS